jgi:RES domain-containing protein
VSSNARDIELLDAIDAFKKEPFSQPVWRITRAGYDPTLGNVSHSRWCNGTFDVLYTSLERDGAIAEIHALLSMQPVFPSKDQRFVRKLIVRANETLRIADLQMLAKLGVDTARYTSRDYKRTQEIADAAYFLGFDGLIAPSARYKGLNAMLFTDNLAPNQIKIVESEVEAVDWKAWKKKYENL